MSDSHLVMIDCGLLPEGVALAAPVPRKTASGAWGGSVSEVLPPEAVASLPLERESGQFLLLKSYCTHVHNIRFTISVRTYNI